jgi:hypothetical protein
MQWALEESDDRGLSAGARELRRPRIDEFDAAVLEAFDVACGEVCCVCA